MPSPGRRDDEVALVHDCTLAIDGSIGAVTFQHEAQRALGVPVGGRDLALHDELHAGIHVCGDLRLPAQARVFEHEDAALG